MPRLLFPGKTPIDDSDAQPSTPASMSMEVPREPRSASVHADSSIDFGELGMMPAILLFGVLYGRTTAAS